MTRILIIAGEVSGDTHGAALLRELKTLNGDIHAFGIGGDILEAEGMENIFHIRDMAFMGIGEVIRHLPFIRKVHQTIIGRTAKEKPDCAILVDYPGFNLRLAKSLDRLNIPVIYYISPQLWAWGRRRVKKVRRYVKKMLVLFPFEEKFYQERGIEAEYVGHPLVDHYATYRPAQHKKIDPENIKIGLLPGSRKQEIISLLPKMIETARILHQEKKIHRAEILKVAHLPETFYRPFLRDADTFIHLNQRPAKAVLPEYDAALVASGTATLECGYFGVPMVIVYHVNPLTYFLGRMLVKVKYIGLANIVAEQKVAEELIQNDFTAPAAAAHISRLLDDEENRARRRQLEIIPGKLGKPGASKRAAEAVLQFLKKR